MNKKANLLTIFLFIIYLGALFWIIVYKFGFDLPPLRNMRSINLIPFYAPKMINGKIDLIEMVMNVLFFIPLGLYTCVLFKNWNIFQKLVFFFFISLILEVLQYVINIGASDLTDIINNTIGGVLGLGFYKLIGKNFKSRIETQKFINKLALLATIIILGILLFLKLNHLFIFRI